MRLSAFGTAACLVTSSAYVAAQTFTDCNPLKKSCPPDPALGRSVTYDFTQGPSSDWKAIGGTPTYGSNGAAFSVAKQGDSPLIQSNWYIMFGRVDLVIKAAPGQGIVSSAVLESDDLDEIDWEWIGGKDNEVQSNYFGKGDTSSYSRGAFHDAPANHDEFHTYTVEWTSEQMVWQIDGKTVRVVTPESAPPNQYPQSPMMVRVGIWAGGDPNNQQGTIDWAGGLTDYSKGPYTMYLKSASITDYSTGKSYSYGDNSGSWQSIISDGGKINGNSDGAPDAIESAPPVTATIEEPVPWSGTHRETSSFVTPSVWPWVPNAPSASSVARPTSVPAGWTSGSEQAQPPSAASSTVHSTSASLASVSASPSSGLEATKLTPTSSVALASSPIAKSVDGPSARVTTLTTSTTKNSFTAELAAATPFQGAAGSIVKAPVMSTFFAFLGVIFAVFYS